MKLAEVLACVSSNHLVWSILEFYGVGEAPSGYSMSEFEELLRTMPGGFTMSWSELMSFAAKIDDTIDCVIVAAASAKDIVEARKRDDGESSWKYYIEAFDSTEWTLSSHNEASGDGFSTLAQCTRVIGR